MTGIVKIVEGLRFYPTCKITSKSATLHGCWQKMQDSSGRDKRLSYSWHKWQQERHICHGYPAAPKSHRANVESPSRGYTFSVFVLQLKKPGWKKPKSFLMGLLKNLPNLCSRKRHYLYNITQRKTCSLLQREPLFLWCKAVCLSNILEKIAKNETYWSLCSLCSQDIQNMRDHEELCQRRCYILMNYIWQNLKNLNLYFFLAFCKI